MQNEEYDDEEFCINITKSTNEDNIIKADEPHWLNESFETASEDNSPMENTKEEKTEEFEPKEKAKSGNGRTKLISMR